MKNPNPDIHYTISLSFEEIQLPPFQDIIVLGKYTPHGKMGLGKSLELLLPNGFQMVEVEHEKVEALFINRRILAKISSQKIIDILATKVFPFISEGELLKVDFKVIISYSNIEQKDFSQS